MIIAKLIAIQGSAASSGSMIWVGSSSGPPSAVERYDDPGAEGGCLTSGKRRHLTYAGPYPGRGVAYERETAALRGRGRDGLAELRPRPANAWEEGPHRSPRTAATPSHREFPRATLLAVGLILLVFILPTLAISVAVPAPHISFTAGVMQAFTSLLDHFGLSVLTQLHILVAQGVIITVIGVLYALVPAVSRTYWVFATLATEVYLIMYVLMFVAAINLRRRAPEHPRGYRAPALLAICVIGTLASTAAGVVGLLPPSQLGHIATVPYLLALLTAILLVGLLPPLLLHKLRRRDWKAAA